MIGSIQAHPKLTCLLVVIALCLVFIGVQVLWIAYSGTPVPRPTIPRASQEQGTGAPLRYAILGDSTSVSQGSEYRDGFAVASANRLGMSHRLTWQNVGISGARAADVLHKQLPATLAFKPDLVLIAVGANDVTHLTSVGDVRQSLAQTIQALRTSNPDMHIILTGSPDMGSVPRFLQPTRWLAGERTERINRMIEQLAHEQAVHLAPIAQRTGPVFRKHPELFAADRFHPNADGYALWNPVVIEAIDGVL